MKFKGLTNIGKRHLAKIHANNGTLEFTKIRFGDGTLRANEDPLNLLQIKNFKMEQEILGAEATDNITSIETVIDNLNLTYGFHVREFGIFVKDGSSEILYYYMNDDIEASWMPPASDGPHKMEIKINMVMANATSVVVNTEDHDLYLTKSYFLKKLAEKMDNIIRKSGFNLDKTDLTENNSNKLFTAKGALDLFNTLIAKITEAVNSAKEYFRTELLKKIDKTAISNSLTSTSTATVLSSAGAKNLEDKKLNIADAWRNYTFIIGDPNTITDLDNITLMGEYSNPRNINKFANSPVTNQAFTLSVTTIDPNNGNYRTQILSTYNTQQIYKRIKMESGWSNWWRLDSGNRLSLNGGTIDGNLKVTGSIETNGIVKNTRDDSSNWSVWKNIVNGGFWALEYHNNPLTPGNMRVNIYFNKGDTYNESTVRHICFGDISAADEYVAYKSWVNAQRTWANVSGKPSTFPPSSHNHTKSQITDFAHTHDDRYFTETEVNAKFNAKHLEIVGKDYGGVLNTAGAKTAGKTYFDNNTKKLYLCKTTNTNTSANTANFIPLDNNSILDRLENLPKLYIAFVGFANFLNGTNITIPIPNGAKNILILENLDNHLPYGNHTSGSKKVDVATFKTSGLRIKGETQYYYENNTIKAKRYSGDWADDVCVIYFEY